MAVRETVGQETKRYAHACPWGGNMQRKVAYVFLYKNGIRERSVGIVRRYGTAEQPEVALELFAEELRKKRWDIFYFTKGEALAEAACLWGSTTERGRSEVRMPRCRLCAEAGKGGGIVLLPAESNWVELREYLCARYDGKEVTAEELRTSFRRKPEPETAENPCVESAKKLMEELTKAAGGETSEMRQGEKTLRKEPFPPGDRKTRGTAITGLEKMLQSKPPYTPCRDGRVDYSVRITPEDLRCLPKESKEYIENSYLLHGYFRYRHMLLGRRLGKGKEEYVLMVPGVYSGKEAGVARLFGFPEFLPVKKTKPETDSAASGGDLFGYFCGKI